MLTEMIGSPTPMRIPLVLAAADPVRRPRAADRAAGVALRAVDRLLDVARTARCSTTRRACARTCSTTSTRWGGARSSAAAGTRGRRTRGATRRSRRGCRTPATRRRGRRMHAPELRDPRGYVIPVDQPDFPTATKFVNALLETGHHRAARDARRSRSPAARIRRRLVRRADGAGVPAARDGHVRAAGAPGRLPVSRRAADAAVRQRGLDARVPDGRSSSIACSTASPAPFETLAAWNVAPPRGTRGEPSGPWRVLRRPAAERRVHRREPAARGRRDAEPRRERRVVRPRDTATLIDSLALPLGVSARRARGAERRRGRAGPRAARRALGPVRRLDGRRVDAVDPRAVRVPVRPRVRAGARRGEPERDVRRARLRRRRDPRRERPRGAAALQLTRRSPTCRPSTASRSGA